MLRLLCRVFLLIFISSCYSAPVAVSEKLPRDSFLLVARKSVVRLCAESACSDQFTGRSGSGFVVANRGPDSVVMTAGHMCEERSNEVHSSMRVFTLQGSMHEVEVIKWRMHPDYCVLLARGLVVPAVKLAAKPVRIGEEVYTLAAPLGIFNIGMVPTLSGYYSGYVARKNLDAFTIPTRGGSSGAPVFNSRGRLVSMTVAAVGGVENFSLGIPYVLVQSIFRSVEKSLRKNQ